MVFVHFFPYGQWLQPTDSAGVAIVPVGSGSVVILSVTAIILSPAAAYVEIINMMQRHIRAICL
jgi:hypothetical protein